MFTERGVQLGNNEQTRSIVKHCSTEMLFGGSESLVLPQVWLFLIVVITIIVITIAERHG